MALAEAPPKVRGLISRFEDPANWDIDNDDRFSDFDRTGSSQVSAAATQDLLRPSRGVSIFPARVQSPRVAALASPERSTTPRSPGLPPRSPSILDSVERTLRDVDTSAEALRRAERAACAQTREVTDRLLSSPRYAPRASPPTATVTLRSPASASTGARAPPPPHAVDDSDDESSASSSAASPAIARPALSKVPSVPRLNLAAVAAGSTLSGPRSPMANVDHAPLVVTPVGSERARPAATAWTVSPPRARPSERASEPSGAATPRRTRGTVSHTPPPAAATYSPRQGPAFAERARDLRRWWEDVVARHPNTSTTDEVATAAARPSTPLSNLLRRDGGGVRSPRGADYTASPRDGLETYHARGQTMPMTVDEPTGYRAVYERRRAEEQAHATPRLSASPREYGHTPRGSPATGPREEMDSFAARLARISAIADRIVDGTAAPSPRETPRQQSGTPRDVIAEARTQVYGGRGAPPSEGANVARTTSSRDPKDPRTARAVPTVFETAGPAPSTPRAPLEASPSTPSHVTSGLARGHGQGAVPPVRIDRLSGPATAHDPSPSPIRWERFRRPAGSGPPSGSGPPDTPRSHAAFVAVSTPLVEAAVAMGFAQGDVLSCLYTMSREGRLNRADTLNLLLDELSSMPASTPIAPPIAPVPAPTTPPAPAPGTCVVCLDEPAATALVPCGHVVLCGACADSHASASCPLCRAPVREVTRIYFS